MRIKVMKDDLRNLRLLEEAEVYRNEKYMGLFLLDFRSYCSGKATSIWKRESSRAVKSIIFFSFSLLAFCSSPGKLTGDFVKSVPCSLATILCFKKIFAQETRSYLMWNQILPINRSLNTYHLCLDPSNMHYQTRYMWL